MQRTLRDNTQHTRETDIHASGGIWTLNPCKRSAQNHALDYHLKMQQTILLTNFITLNRKYVIDKANSQRANISSDRAKSLHPRQQN
jgi:hypothetical protein